MSEKCTALALQEQCEVRRCRAAAVHYGRLLRPVADPNEGRGPWSCFPELWPTTWPERVTLGPCMKSKPIT